MTIDAAPESDSDNGTFRKGVVALAIQPLTMAWSSTGRKAYDVMLRMAQRSRPDEQGGFTAPLSAIIEGYSGNTKTADRVRRYIEQMVQTTVVLHLVSNSDEETLTLDGFEVLPAQGEGGPREWRVFPLLAEARCSFVRGRWWLTWYYPPSIMEALLKPERWAQIELASIARLGTYTAIALYEICARFKGVPGGMTSRHKPDWWSAVLREGGTQKAREWRKFKSELLVPAIADVNANTEIHIELVEHRLGAGVDQVQFRVKKQARAEPEALQPVSVEVPMEAAALGIKEADIDPLIDKFGSWKVAEGLSRLKAQIDRRPHGIGDRTAYLRTILANDPEALGNKPAQTELLDDKPKRNRPLTHGDLLSEWDKRRLKQVKVEFAELPHAEQDAWIEKAQQALPATGHVPQRRRLEKRDWQSPSVVALVVEPWAAEKYGDAWKKPSEADLADLLAELRHQA